MRVAIEGQDIADTNVGEIVQEHVIEILLELILKIHEASSGVYFFTRNDLLLTKLHAKPVYKHDTMPLKEEI